MRHKAQICPKCNQPMVVRAGKGSTGKRQQDVYFECYKCGKILRL